MLEKKAEKLRRLTERYYGKKDILDTWDEHNGNIDMPYRNDLKRRVTAHRNDLMYRGEDPQ